MNEIERKIMKEVMNDIKLKRIPRRDNRIVPIVSKCKRCKKKPVTDHHIFCNDCWKETHGKQNNR